MTQKIGFLLIIAGIVFCLQPDLFKTMLGAKASIPDDHSLIAKSNNRGGEEETQYAAGYSEEDFGAAFNHPMDGKFPLAESYRPIGPWETLLNLKIKVRFDQEADDVLFEPKFSEKIRAYEGEIIELEGFIIPHDVAGDALSNAGDDGTKFMFSAFPLASCFFCGEAGVESVMEVSPKKPVSYTEDKVILRGRLELNGEDLMRLPYLLKDVELVYDRS